ncbi:MAG: DUF7009 family protein [Chitinophagaceae bacterium]
MYRLKNEDIDFLKQNKYCKESLSIGNSSLLFCLESKDVDKTEVLFKENSIKIILPKSMLEEWLHSEIIEIKFLIGDTTFFIEKDL